MSDPAAAGARQMFEQNSAYALESLRSYIAGLDLPQGSRLPTERQLAERFGIGRRAVRRALDVLEAEALITRRRGAGTFIGHSENALVAASSLLAATDFAEIMEVRLRIEPQLAQLAAVRASDSQIAHMRAMAARIVDAGDADARELWDGTFHRQIAQAAGNRLFLALFDMVNRIRQDDAWRTIRERARADSGSLPASVIHHEEIVAAIAAHDPAAAGEAMRQHLLLLQESLIRQTSQGGADAQGPIPADPITTRLPERSFG